MNNENYRKEYLNNLIAINSLSEILAEQENPEFAIVNKLKERTLQLYQTLVAIEFDGKNTPARTTARATYETPPVIAPPVTAIEHNSAFVENATPPNQYSNADLNEFNTEINQLFTAPPTNEIAPVVTSVIEEVTPPEFTVVEPIVDAPTIAEVVAPVAVLTPTPTQLRTPLQNFLGFNDKLLIQRNLFDNNNASLTNFMTEIDNCETSHKAIGLINDYKIKLNWDKESEAFHSLIGCIEQKFR